LADGLPPHVCHLQLQSRLGLVVLEEPHELMGKMVFLALLEEQVNLDVMLKHLAAVAVVVGFFRVLVVELLFLAAAAAADNLAWV
jgi:hypothetical protein